jgi:hypothetical protein
MTRLANVLLRLPFADLALALYWLAETLAWFSRTLRQHVQHEGK